MRAILRASAIMGSSSVLTILLSIVRQKVIAVELGPSGVGILGFLLTGLTLATTLFSVGIGQSGIRYIAVAAEQGRDALARTRGALTVAAHLLAAVALAGAFLFRIPLAALLEADPRWMPWFGIGVWASVVSAGQLAVVNGLRRIGHLARAQVAGAALGTVVTVIAVLVAREAGLVAAVIGAPVGTWLAALWFTRDVPFRWPSGAGAFLRRVRPVLALGAAFSTSLMLMGVTQLLVRIDIEAVLGLEAAGFFQASWAISKVYMGFVLTALGAEYFPRISALAESPGRLNRAVREQISLVVPLAGAALLPMIVLAPLVLRLLYSVEFTVTTALLRWQLAGDVLKVAAWALSYHLLAREARWAFFAAEFLWNAAFVLSIHLFLPRFGLEVAGFAYLASYVIYFFAVLLLARLETAFNLGLGPLSVLVALLAAAVTAILLLERPEPAWTASAALAGGTFLACLLSVVRKMREPRTPLARQESS